MAYFSVTVGNSIMAFHVAPPTIVIRKQHPQIDSSEGVVLNEGSLYTYNAIAVIKWMIRIEQKVLHRLIESVPSGEARLNIEMMSLHDARRNYVRHD